MISMLGKWVRSFQKLSPIDIWGVLIAFFLSQSLFENLSESFGMPTNKPPKRRSLATSSQRTWIGHKDWVESGVRKAEGEAGQPKQVTSKKQRRRITFCDVKDMSPKLGVHTHNMPPRLDYNASRLPHVRYANAHPRLALIMLTLRAYQGCDRGHLIVWSVLVDY